MAKTNLLQRAVLGVTVTLATVALGYMTQGGHSALAAPSSSVSESLKVRGVTKPSDESNLAFNGPGIVDTVVVEAGSPVKAGMVLATQDARDELAKLEVSKLQADSTKEIEAADADLAAKKVDLKRKEDLFADKIGKGESCSELDEARVAVKIDEIAVAFRKESKKEKELELKLQQVKVEQKKLISPIDGVVTKVDIHPGEGVDLTKPGIQVVRIDPLWVEVDIPSSQARLLKKGDKLLVNYGDEKGPATEAPIIFLTSWANAGSGTRKVRLLMSNPDGREAGLQVTVQLPETQTAAAK